jgi:uncharacterized protein YfdQ (DUF2303 family)
MRLPKSQLGRNLLRSCVELARDYEIASLNGCLSNINSGEVRENMRNEMRLIFDCEGYNGLANWFFDKHLDFPNLIIDDRFYCEADRASGGF